MSIGARTYPHIHIFCVFMQVYCICSLSGLSWFYLQHNYLCYRVPYTVLIHLSVSFSGNTWLIGQRTSWLCTDRGYRCDQSAADKIIRSMAVIRFHLHSDYTEAWQGEHIHVSSGWKTSNHYIYLSFSFPSLTFLNFFLSSVRCNSGIIFIHILPLQLYNVKM